MADQQIDPRIYGGEPITPRPELNAARVAQQYTPPTPAPVADVFKGSTLLAQGEANLTANAVAKASVLESVGGAMTQWLPVHAYEYWNAPTFAKDQYFDATTYMRENVDYRMDSADEEFMLKAQSAPDAAWRLQNMKDRNLAYQAMGDHSVAALITGVIDPGYLAMDLASAGTTRLARIAGGAGKLTAGGTAAALTYGAGLMQAEVQPVSAVQLIGNALLNGAATGMFFRDGALRAIDPTFPGEALTRKAAAVEQGVVKAGDEVGETAVVADPAMTTSRVPATGSGRTPVRAGSGANAHVDDYDPTVGLSKAEQSTLANDGRVQQVNSAADIANHVDSVRKGFTVIEPDAKAVYLPQEDRLFLIKENIKPTDDIKGIMLHEYGVHMNAERVLGTDKLGSMLNRLEDLALSGETRAKQAFADVPSNTPQHLVREEALGYYIERNHGNFKDGFVNKMIVGMRAALRKSGMSGLKLSEREIVDLVRQAAKGGEKVGKTSFDTTFPNVWHGSPVRGFDAMKVEFMGTGEGAQAFGWGHYLTSEKGTALNYRNKEALRRGKAPEEGGLYRVRMNATVDQFLDLDARVQSPSVQAVLTELGVREGVTGKTAYDYLAKTLGGQRKASEELLARGVVGNKYATGRTRLSGEKSSNYVAFGDSVVDVSARYSRPLMPTAKAAIATVASSQKTAKAIEWSWHKTMSQYSNKAAEIADTLLDDPLKGTQNSAASVQRALRADLASLQYKYEGLLLDALSTRGYGVLKRGQDPAGAIKAQQSIEKDLYKEMLRRNRAHVDGKPLNTAGVPPEITAMADSLDTISKRALKEMQAAGVAGAEAIDTGAGYVSRRWDVAKLESIAARMEAHGPLPAGYARTQIVDTISIGIQRANGWDAQLSSDVAGAIYDRTLRRGQFIDAELHGAQAADAAEHVRGILTSAGITGVRLEKAMAALVGQADDAGKLPSLKRRIDMNMDESLTLPDGSSVSIGDMLDTNVAAITERYLDTVSAQAALAKKGLVKPSDISDLRKQLADSVSDLGQREKAVESFDEMLNVMRGLPVGEPTHQAIRNTQALTQMVGLGASGLWQLTEYAPMMLHYGAINTMKNMVKELPFVRNMVQHEATSLREVLARNSAQDTRLRPFINRMEDNFEVPMSDTVSLALQNAKQWVPYVNGMKYVQHHQARVTANLIVDTVVRAVKGDASAIKAMEGYGLESGSMIAMRNDIAAHGMDTVKWTDATWQAVREPLTKMMDESVLRARLGEMPQFAHTSTLGKFLFTFRSFVLAAHNKVLAGTLNKQGYAGMSLLLLYQIPLTVLAVQANTAIQGKKQKTLGEDVKAAFGQVGALGLFGELFGVMTGNKQQFGAPGLIGIDRLYKVAGAVSSGSAGNTGAALLNSIPILSSFQPLKAAGEALKEEPTK